MSPFKIIIIGAGLSGTCLANGLLRHGIEVQVYERLPQDSKREGYQIRLGAHALRGLRACLSQDQLQQIVAKFGPANGSKSEAPIVVNRDFKTVLDLSRFPTYSKSAPISRVVLRDALAEPVAAAGRLKYGVKFERYEILGAGTAEESVRVWFEDGSCDECDVLVAADGSHSKVNKQIGLDNISDVEGYVSMIAKNELPTKRFLATNPRIVEKPILAFADNKSMYYCAYLPQSLEQDGKYDESLSSSFFGLHVPSDSGPKNFANMSPSAQWEFVSQAFSGWGKEYHEIVDLVRDSDLYVYRGRVSKDPGKGWRSRVQSSHEPERGHHRVWMVGDSMHAMLPNRGMGGNTALCDCDKALQMLTKLSSFASSSGRVVDTAVKQTCKEYEYEMMPRAFGWVKASGGSNMVPIDASTIIGRAIFALAAIAMQVAGYIYAFAALFVDRKFVDDAPELR